MPKYTGKYVQFTFPISAYHPEALQNGYTERELRREYSRLRDIAQKRLKRLGASEFSDTQDYKYNVGRFIPTREVSGMDELSHLLSDISKFLTASLSTVTGQKEYRRKSIESLNEGGLKGINEGNFRKMTNMLEWASAFKEYDPSELVRMINAYAEAGVDLDLVFQHLAELYDEWIATHTIMEIPEDWDE